jgi:hypothetical protein
LYLWELHEENQAFFGFFGYKLELIDFEEAKESMWCIGHGLACVANLS